VWTVRVHQPGPWLTANIDRYRYRRAALVRAWRLATVDACAAAELPHGITPVSIDATVCYTRPQPPVRDRLNMAPTLKACVDALTPARTIHRGGKVHHVHGYGLLPDDSDRHVLETTWHLSRANWDGIQLRITAAPQSTQQQPLFDLNTIRS